MPIDIEQRKTELEPLALSVSGVVGIAIGLSKSGQRVIKIFVDHSPSTINLPQELIAADIECEYIGNVSAQ